MANPATPAKAARPAADVKPDRWGLIPIDKLEQRMPKVELHLGDCLEVLRTLPDASVDAVISDPPYPEINRPYGRMTEAEWHEMMREVVRQTRRILKPKGSAVFILQPNYERIGRTRLWLWEFVAWAGREWNLIEDHYWWNPASLPNAGCERRNGLCRRSVKPCVWLGPEDCYRDQDAVLWLESQRNIARRSEARATRQEGPSGNGVDNYRCTRTAVERGGVTPFNLLPVSNTASNGSAGSHGHGAGTPEPLADWWIRYISPPGGIVADWFSGTATMGMAAIKRGRSYIGIERDPEYHAIAERRIAEAAA